MRGIVVTIRNSRCLLSRCRSHPMGHDWQFMYLLNNSIKNSFNLAQTFHCPTAKNHDKYNSDKGRKRGTCRWKTYFFIQNNIQLIHHGFPFICFAFWESMLWITRIEALRHVPSSASTQNPLFVIRSSTILPSAFGMQQQIRMLFKMANNRCGSRSICVANSFEVGRWRRRRRRRSDGRVGEWLAA